MATQVDVIKQFIQGLIEAGNKDLTGTSAVDYAIKSLNINGVSNYSSLKTAFSSSLNTYLDGSSTYSSDYKTKLQRFLERACGVRVNNDDTGAITGSDAGGTTTKTNESIIPESSTVQALTDSEYNSFTKNGLTVNVTYDTLNPYYDDYNYDNDYYVSWQKEIVSHLYNWWIPETLDLINESLGLNFTDGKSNTTNINIEFQDNTFSSAAMFDWTVDKDLGIASKVTLKINTKKFSPKSFSQFDANDKDGTYTSSYDNKYSYINNKSYSYSDMDYVDRVFAKDLTQILLMANIPHFDELPGAIQVGLSNIVDGRDDPDASISKYTTFSDTSYYGYSLLRYMAKQYASEVSSGGETGTDSGQDTTSGGSSTDTIVSGGGGGTGTSTQSGEVDADGDGLIFNKGKTAVTITADYENEYFDAADYDDTLVTIDASKTRYGLEITGNENNNSIIGGKGDDTLNGDDGNDTLTGGRGNDVFVYTKYSGDDIITDYKPGEDTIEFKSAINDYSFKGTDVIFKVGSNTLTVKNMNGKEITVTDENGDTTTKTYIDNKTEVALPLGVKYNSSKTSITISKKFTDEEIDLADYVSMVKTVNATASNQEMTIIANENNNVIKVGKKATTVYGGTGNDQITGGKGADALYGEDDDDKLVGGSGADTLSGGDGNDTMTGGAGKDVFIYDGNGNDIITDYKAGQDVIQISDEVEFESVTVKGKNVTFNLDGGSLMIKNGKNKKITFVDEDGEAIFEDKYKKSATLDRDDEDDERDFVESIDEPWFAKDNNFKMNNVEMTINNEMTYSIGKIDTSDVLTNLDNNLNKEQLVMNKS